MHTKTQVIAQAPAAPAAPAGLAAPRAIRQSTERARQRVTRPAPLLPFAIGMCIGIAAENRVPVDPRLTLAFAALAGLALCLLRKRRYPFAALAVISAVFCGAGLHHIAYRTVAPNHLVTFAGDQPSPARITGRIVTTPNIYRRGNGPFSAWLFDLDRTSLVLEADGIETRNAPASATGLLRVVIREPAVALRQGQEVEAFGVLYRPRPPRNPGQFDWQQFNARRGLYVTMMCDHAANVRIQPEHSDGTAGWRERMRNRVRRLLHDDRIEKGDETASLLDAMVLGRRSAIDRNLEETFIATGCAHYLAVSGFHVGILAAAVWFFVRFLPIGRSTAAWVVLLTVMAYTLVAEPRPPILRAAILTSAICISLMAKRPFSTTNALSLAALCILVVQPTSLFDAGFQLSFEAVAAIMFVTPAVSDGFKSAAVGIRRRLARRPVSAEIEAIAARVNPDRTWPAALSRVVWMTFCVTVTAWLASLPIVAAHFGRIAVWGWLCSLIALPFVVVVVILGFLSVAVGIVLPIAAAPLGALLTGASTVLLAVMKLLAGMPSATISLPTPPVWIIASFYVALAGVVAYHRGLIPRKYLSLNFLPLVVTLLVWCIALRSPSGLRITQFAVGRGTTTLIELPDGTAWVYDVGASGATDAGRDVLVPYLRQHGIRRINGVILSHPNLDHFGGAISLIDAVPTGPIYVTGHFERYAVDGGPSGALMAELKRRSHPVIRIDAETELDWPAGVGVDVLWPQRAAPAELDANNSSIVLRINYCDRTILFTGDIGYAAQQWLMEHEDVSADVLILPHHGAVVANTGAFLDAVGAGAWVRSSFVRSSESLDLQRLATEVDLFNTADAGAVSIVIAEDGTTVECFAGNRATTIQ